MSFLLSSIQQLTVSNEISMVAKRVTYRYFSMISFSSKVVSCHVSRSVSVGLVPCQVLSCLLSVEPAMLDSAEWSVTVESISE